MGSVGSMVKIAALGDLHCSKTTPTLHTLFSQISESADVLLLCGDLTDYGLPEEARFFAKELSAVRIPVVAVLGNHDFESGKADEVRSIVAGTGAQVLDGDTCEVHGIGFAGVKGFAGGFGRGTLGPWGEDIIKHFVQEAVNETLKLESALARLRNTHRIALMHYSPVQSTVEGEPREIFPFLGCSRLEEPLGRYPVSAVVHGHAHHGTLFGRTASNVPVYNVSFPLLRAAYPQRPFQLIELDPATPLHVADSTGAAVG